MSEPWWVIGNLMLRTRDRLVLMIRTPIHGKTIDIAIGPRYWKASVNCAWHRRKHVVSKIMFTDPRPLLANYFSSWSRVESCVQGWRLCDDVSYGIGLTRIELIPYVSNHFETLQWRHNERDGVSNHRRVHCLFSLGDNDRAARVLFVQHPREQGEWCSQNPSVARVLTQSFALLPQFRDIFTEIRATHSSHWNVASRQSCRW